MRKYKRPKSIIGKPSITVVSAVPLHIRQNVETRQSEPIPVLRGRESCQIDNDHTPPGEAPPSYDEVVTRVSTSAMPQEKSSSFRLPSLLMSSNAFSSSSTPTSSSSSKTNDLLDSSVFYVSDFNNNSPSPSPGVRSCTSSSAASTVVDLALSIPNLPPRSDSLKGGDYRPPVPHKPPRSSLSPSNLNKITSTISGRDETSSLLVSKPRTKPKPVARPRSMYIPKAKQLGGGTSRKPVDDITVGVTNLSMVDDEGVVGHNNATTTKPAPLIREFELKMRGVGKGGPTIIKPMERSGSRSSSRGEITKRTTSKSEGGSAPPRPPSLPPQSYRNDLRRRKISVNLGRNTDNTDAVDNIRGDDGAQSVPRESNNIRGDDGARSVPRESNNIRGDDGVQSVRRESDNIRGDDGPRPPVPKKRENPPVSNSADITPSTSSLSSTNLSATVSSPSDERVDVVEKKKDPSIPCTALYEYVSEVPGDLTFNAGDHITLSEYLGDSKEWARGWCGDRVGIFPVAYVTLTPPPTQRSVTDAATSSNPPQVEQRSVTALYDYQSKEIGDLCFQCGDIIVITGEVTGDWFTGYLQSDPSKTGMFPSEFVTPDGNQAVGAVQMVDVESTGDRAQALYDFTGMEGEISFNRGDMISEIIKVSEEWWEGYHNVSGSRGRFPSNHVSILLS